MNKFRVTVKILTKNNVQVPLQMYKNYHSLQHFTKVIPVSCHEIKQLSVTRQFSLLAWPQFLTTWRPVLVVQDTFIQIHDSSGLPWWTVILLSTVALRSFITLPLAIHQYQVVARMENMRKEMSEIAPELNKEVSIAARLYNWDMRTSRRIFKKNMREQYQKIIIRDNCHPAKAGLLVLFQVPMWICFSASLRNIYNKMPYQDYHSLITFLQLKSEGVLWFVDMTCPDSFFLIPVLLGTVNLSLIEMNSLRKLAPGSLLQKFVLNIARVITLWIVIVASFSPSCLSFYWLCSSVFGLGQNILFLMPKVRRFCNIPVTPSESATPFKDIWNNLRTVIHKRF